MEKQTTNTVLMIRPAHFGYNPETAMDNEFQQKPGAEDKNASARALEEFDQAVKTLTEAGVNVLVYEDTDQPVKTDAVFPNNWFSTHQDGTVLTYPMSSPNRRAEVRQDIIDDLATKFKVTRDYTMVHYVEDNLFLEGTGSLILDRTNKVAFACLSPRTSIQLLDKWAVIMGYKVIYFNALSADDKPIYHTNVMMCLGEKFVIICLETVKDDAERERLLKWFDKLNKEVISITEAQMNAFAGNMLELRNNLGQRIVVCSTTAQDVLNPEQKARIEHFAKLVPIEIDTIERLGGGSARCMIAEIFLQKK